MSKKSFRSQASSARVASAAASGFGGFGTKPFGSHSSPLSFVYEAPDLTGVQDPNTAVVLRNLMKKDSATKIRALEDLKKHLEASSADPDIEDPLVDAWVKLYPRLTIDANRRVRAYAHQVTGIVAGRIQRRIAPHLTTIAPPWLAGTFDSDRAAAEAAKGALHRAFTAPDKIQNLVKTFHQAILDYCVDAVTNETVDTLSDQRAVSADDANATYARVVSTSVALITKLFRELDVSQQKSIYQALWSDEHFWSFASHSDAVVRKNFLRAIQACHQKHPDLLCRLDIISSALVDKALHSDQTNSAEDLVTVLCILTSSHPTIWTTDYHGRKSALDRLGWFVGQTTTDLSSQSHSQVFWDLVCQLPAPSLPHTLPEAIKFLSFFKQTASRRAGSSHNYHVWILYFRIANLLYDHIPATEYQALLEQNVLPVFEQYLYPDTALEEWTIDSSSAKNWIGNIGSCRHIIDGLMTRWPGYQSRLVETIKLSLPEQSKEFHASQTAVINAGRRWISLQLAFEETGPMQNLCTGTIHDLVCQVIDQLRSRNAKPYGAAALLEFIIVHACRVWSKDERIFGKVTDYLSQDISTWIHSPSLGSLIDLIYHLDSSAVHNGQQAFIKAWQDVITYLEQNAHDSRSQYVARAFLLSPRVNRATDMAQQSQFVQCLLQQEASRMVSDAKSAVFVNQILQGAPGIMTVETTDIILSGLLNALDGLRNIEPTIKALQGLVTAEDQAFRDRVADSFGDSLLPKLISIEETADEAVASKASDLIEKLLTVVTQHDGSSTVPLLINKSLTGTTSTSSLSVSTLIDMFDRSLAQSVDQDFAPLSPEALSWDSVIRSSTFIRPPTALSIIDRLGGMVFLVSKANPMYQSDLSFDSNGYSRALRVAMLVCHVLASPESERCIDAKSRSSVLRHLALTLVLVQDEISLTGATNIFRTRTKADESELLAFVDQAKTLISQALRKCITTNRSEDDKHAIEVAMDQCYSAICATEGLSTTESERVPVFSYYNARAYVWLAGDLSDLRGTGNGAVEDFVKTIEPTRRDHDIKTIIGLDVYRDILRNHPVVRTLVNEQVAELTSADGVGQSAPALWSMLLFNTATSGQQLDDGIVASQRLVVLVKHLLDWLDDTAIIEPLKIETMRALVVLLPAIRDLYGEHWNKVLQCVMTLWKENGSLKEKEELTKGDRVALVNASLRLLGVIRSLSTVEEPNDDLVDAWKENQSKLAEGLIDLLVQHQDVFDETNKPLQTTNDLISRELSRLPKPQNLDKGSLYPLLIAPSRSIQRSALTLLQYVVRRSKEQISFEAALDKKAVHLPNELLSLVLEAPPDGSWHHVSFDQGIPLELQGYLHSWLLIFEHFSDASYQVKSDYIEDLKAGSYLTLLLDFTYDYLSHSQGRQIDVSGFEIASYDPDTEMLGEKKTQWLLTHLYYLLLTHTPSLAKTHYLSIKSRQTSLAVSMWTSKYISPLIIEASLASVSEWAQSPSAKTDPDFENFTVKVSTRSREVQVSYLVDNQTMAILVRLPESYPFDGASVEGVSRVGVDERRWTSWIRNCQGVITSSNGNLIDGLNNWRKNVVGALKGQTECAVCYSIISGDKQLPNKRCGTCKNLFHGSCLFKWFKSSNASTCPLCRNPFNYG